MSPHGGNEFFEGVPGGGGGGVDGEVADAQVVVKALNPLGRLVYRSVEQCCPLAHFGLFGFGRDQLQDGQVAWIVHRDLKEPEPQLNVVGASARLRFDESDAFGQV